MPTTDLVCPPAGDARSATDEMAAPSSVGHRPGLPLAWRALLGALVILAASRFFFPIEDPDLFWHVVIGRWILDHGAVPTSEHWNFFGLGHPFRAYSWSSEVFYALVERHFGLRGLWWAQGGLGLGVLAIATAAWRRLSRSFCLTSLAALFFIFAADPFISLRPQVVTFALFALLPPLAESLIARGVRLKSAIALLLVFAVWANTHLAMILGLGYLGGLLFSFDRARVRLTAQALLLACLGTIATPDFAGTWQTFFATIGHVGLYRGEIEEFAPLSLTHRCFPCWAFAAAIVAAISVKRWRGLPLFEVLVAAAFLLLGAYAVKFMPFAFLAAIAFALKHGTPLIDEGFCPAARKRFAGLHSSLGRLLDARLARLLAALLAALCLALFAAHLVVETRRAPLLAIFSEKALDFVFRNNLPRPILSNFNNGGYLMYRLSDARGQIEHPVAIDGRTNILSRDEARSYYRLESGAFGWREFIELYRPGAIVWPARAKTPLPQILREGREWCERFSGRDTVEGYSVFTKCGLDEEGRLEK